MVEVRYVVDDCQLDEFTVEAVIAGTDIPVTAKVPGVIVQLVAEDGSTSFPLRLRPAPDQVEQTLADFAVGTVITAQYNPAA